MPEELQILFELTIEQKNRVISSIIIAICHYLVYYRFNQSC